jgi:serine/threonine-protein kinase
MATRPFSSTATDEGRFPVGTILGERFRVLGFLGRGGMGEVYRVFDLKLDQPVALKFLPAATAGNPRLLERFRGEVRIARQVSHRNVCRVHDIGEADGAAFLSMEYVDGEDLRSLLGKIGRLPPDKAMEIARKLCAGLAAAHEKGVLHRDLKPANIMLDSRGQVLIMDFGLAAAADSIPGADVRSGTPAYMAPEQKEGREVTARSDVYSLGLVLREIFTGQRGPLDGAPTTTVKDFDPAVEKVIQRCLDPNPRNRPASALDVARALPGGDPLAEALAAGDTPSPAMVAASDDTGIVSVRAAIACLVWILIGLAPALLLTARASVVRGAPLPDSPEILARTARDIVGRLGYTDPPVDSAYGFRERGDFNEWARDNLDPETYRTFVARGQPSAIEFWYRQSPSTLWAPDGAVSFVSPPQILPNMTRTALDPEGRLTRFEAIPPEEMPPAPTQPADWKPVFEAARLDPTLWSPAAPRKRPPASFDEQASWIGTYAHAPDLPLRIEAAAWRGRIVHFEIAGPWTGDSPVEGAPPVAVFVLASVITWPVVVGVVLLAWHNHRRGRGDTRGAVRLALFAAALGLGERILGWQHPFVAVLPLRVLDVGGDQLLTGLSLLVLYTALEPYVRRRWPQSLISWTRLLEGRWRDPVVAGHVLIGVALGIGFRLLIASGSAQGSDIERSTAPMLGPVKAIGSWLGSIQGGITVALGFLLAVFTFRAVLRRTWIAVSAALVLVGLLRYSSPTGALPSVALAVSVAGFAMTTLLRFGVLPLVVSYAVSNILASSTFGTDLSAWYAPTMLLAAGAVAGLAVWSFRNALGGRRVWTGEFLE